MAWHVGETLGVQLRGVLLCWMLIVISSQRRGWGYGPQKLFGVVYYTDILLLYDLWPLVCLWGLGLI